MTYQIIDNQGEPIDAHFELEDNELIILARGGGGKGKSWNRDYGQGLRLLLDRIISAGFQVIDAWVDSNRVQNFPLSERRIIDVRNIPNEPDLLFDQLSRRMRLIGRHSGTRGGNSTRRIRLQISGEEAGSLLAALGGRKVAQDIRSRERLPASDFDQVEVAHVERAIQKLLDESEKHPYGSSIYYDLVLSDGVRLPPKAVFGLAASEALGFDVLPKHFSAGEDSLCFRALRRCGYQVSPKDGDGGHAQALQEVEKELEDEGYFNPDAEEERERRMRSIVCRQGQPVFRRELIEAYEGRCAVTGYDLEMALEAAHIKPYSGPQSNHVKNGLLLRADIHTLFDLDLLGINPETLEVVLSDQLLNTLYSDLAGKRLFLPEDSAKHPIAQALERRWLEFQDSTGAKKAVGRAEDSGDGFWNALLFTPDRDGDVAIEKEEKFKKLRDRFHRAGLGESFERLVSTGERLNLYRRLNKNSVMHTPRGNKSLCAYTVKISGGSLFVAHGATTLDEFFGVPQSESREWGEGDWERLDAAQVEEYCSWLEAAARPEDESGGKAG